MSNFDNTPLTRAYGGSTNDAPALWTGGTTDSVATVRGSQYFNDVISSPTASSPSVGGMQGGDLIQIMADTGGTPTMLVGKIDDNGTLTEMSFHTNTSLQGMGVYAKTLLVSDGTTSTNTVTWADEATGIPDGSPIVATVKEGTTTGTMYVLQANITSDDVVIKFNEAPAGTDEVHVHYIDTSV